MFKRLGNQSLQTRIMFLFILMSLALTLTLGGVFYNNTINQVKDSKIREMTTLAVETGNKIDRFLFERSGDAKALAESRILLMSDVTVKMKKDYLKNVVQAYQTYSDIYVLDEKGQILFSAMDQEDGNIETFKQQILSEKLFISNLIYSSAYQDYLIYFSKPIYDENGAVRGAVVEKMNFEAINEIVNTVKLGDTGHVSLRKVNEADALDAVIGTRTIKVDGINYLTAVVPIKKYVTQEDQWVLEVKQTEKEAFKVILSIERYFALVIIVVLLIFFIVSSLLSKSITKPIRTLKMRISEIMETNKMNEVLNASSDEVKQLTLSFDVLLEELNFMMQKVLEKSGEAAYVKEIKSSIGALFEHMPSGILTVDNKGEITSVNPVGLELLGMESDQLVGLNVKSFKIETSEAFNYLQGLIALMRDGLDSKRWIDDEVIELINQGGDCRKIVVSLLRQVDMYDSVIGLTLVVQSFEEKQNFQARVFKAKQLSELGELSAGVAHEIRNPLTSIRGYTQLALSEVMDESQISSDLQVVLSEVDRLDKIIERFMSFASPNAPQYGNHAVHAMIHDTVRLLAREFYGTGIELKYQLNHDAWVEMDYDQIKQVLINLLLNAIQALPHGGVINLITKDNPEEFFYELSVEDTGEGIDEDRIDKIFSPFYTTRNEGTGLGLSICSRIVENHKGVLEVISQKGTGTKFTIKLPYKKG